MKILVTGSKGFIGTHLVKALKKADVEVFEFDLKNYNDILSKSDLNPYFYHNEFDFVIHLAAVSNLADCNQNPTLALETNIMGTFNVLMLAKKFHVPVIVASTAAVKMPNSSIYASSKDAMEIICGLYDQVKILMLYNVYGKGSKSVVNKIIKKVKEEKPFHLNGDTTRDYVYIGDVVTQFMNIIANFHPGVVELGTGVATRLGELVNVISKQVGKRPIVIQDKPLPEIQISFMRYDPDSDDDKMDWVVARTSLVNGIKKLI